MTAVPKVGWVLELAGPYPHPRGLSLFFDRDIGEGILPASDRLALAHHPLVEVDATFGAYRDHAAIAVHVALLAGHDAAPDPVRERERSFLPTAIGCTETMGRP